MYRALKRAHGIRGWWPVFRPSAKASAKPVYDPRRKTLTSRQRFEVAVGAILTQNTAWSNVSKALQALHRARALSPESIARMPRSRLAALIRPSGYFNQKSIKLKKFARYVIGFGSTARWIDRLRRMPPEAARGELLGLHGVGPETADSILLYAIGNPIFVVDAYTRRIFARHGWIRGDEPYEEIRKTFEAAPGKGVGRSAVVELWNDYHAQIVEVGKRYCHRRGPDCLRCPLYRREFFSSEGRFENPVLEEAEAGNPG